MSSPRSQASLAVANSGTSLRFLTAILSTGQGTFHLDGSPRMRQRPISDLLVALNGLGAKAKSDLGTGCPPVTIEANGLDGGSVFVRGDVSSQFLSGLLMALPAARQPTTVEVEGVLVSRPYVAMTLAVMESFGVTAANRNFRRFDVPAAAYIGREYVDRARRVGGQLLLRPGRGDGGCRHRRRDWALRVFREIWRFVDVLEQMGCTVKREPAKTTVIAGPLHAVDVDMNAFSDTVMTLAVVALFARGVTRIRNVAHIRHKETDRIAALATELRKLGTRVDELADGLVIDPPQPDRLRGARIPTYNDHRMAMSFALAGLVIPGVTILDPGCVKKTYPDFWTDLETLRTSSHLNRPEPSAPA